MEAIPSLKPLNVDLAFNFYLNVVIVRVAFSLWAGAYRRVF